jgi:hypothetical protein
MRKFLRALGALSLIVGLVLCLLGTLAFAAGELMFALPYVFLAPGLALAAVGGLALFLTRSNRARK